MWEFYIGVNERGVHAHVCAYSVQAVVSVYTLLWGHGQGQVHP